MRRVVVVDSSKSPAAKLQPVGLTEVTLNDAFWAPRRVVNREKTLPQQWRQCEATGRIDNFRRASGHARRFARKLAIAIAREDANYARNISQT